MKESYSINSVFFIEERDVKKDIFFLRDFCSIEHIDTVNDTYTFKERYIIEDIKHE